MQLAKYLNVQSVEFLNFEGNCIVNYKGNDLLKNKQIVIDHNSLSSCNSVKIKLSQTPLQAKYIRINFNWKYDKRDIVLCNGFQSWTLSNYRGIDDRIPKLRPALKVIWNHYKMQHYGNYLSFIAQSEILHSYNFAEIKTDKSNHKIKTSDETFGVFMYDKQKSELGFISELSKQSAEHSFHILNGKNKEWIDLKEDTTHTQLHDKSHPLAGWCSWYNFYSHISEDLILNQLQNFIDYDIPISIFQIDDGWQKAIGDWTENQHFPNGLEVISSKINKRAYDAGIWLAPFIVEEDALIIKKHPDWIRRDQNDNKIVAGYNPDWSGNFYCLEWRLPEVQAYLKSVFDNLRKGKGFTFFKLDFLYAVTIGANKPQFVEMQEAMIFLKSIIAPAKILACGVPLKNSHKNVDYCRISGDVALCWEDIRLSKAIRYRERVSTYAALRSSLTRSPYNASGFGIDPDVYLLRKENNKLNEAQKNTLFLINQVLGDLLFNSDDISKYDKITMQKYVKQFPLRNKEITSRDSYLDSGWIKFSANNYNYLLAYNISSKKLRLKIPSESYDKIGINNQITLSPYESKILLITSDSSQLLLSSDGHIFPGNEVSSLHLSANKLSLKVDPASKIKKINYVFRLPLEINQIEIDGVSYKSQMLSDINIIRYSYLVNKAKPHDASN